MKKIFGLITFIATLGLLFGTSFAKEASFYGSARTQTFFTNQDKDLANLGTEEFDTAKHGVLGTSRFGAKVTDGDKFGNFEINSSGGIRHLYGTVKVGLGTLILGHTWTPANMFLSNQAYGDDGLANYGAPLNMRAGQITYSVANFKVGLVDPTAIGAKAAPAGTVSAAMPAIEFNYSQNFNPVAFTVYGGVSSLEYKTATPALNTEIDSNLFGLLVKGNFGPAMVGVSFFQGTNLDFYPTWAPKSVVNAPDFSTASNVKDTTTTGIALVASYKVTDTFGVEAGYGMLTAENDTFKKGTTSVDDESATMYIQFPVTVADGFTVTPEYTAIDYKDGTDGTAQGKETAFGVKCQLDF